MTDNLSGRTVAFLATSGFEQVELTSPWQAVKDAGGTPVLLSLEPADIRGVHGDTEQGDTFEVEAVVAHANAPDYRALMLPGGVVNADKIRIDPDAQRFTREFFDAHKPVAAICHAPWLLIEAGVVSGRELTSYKTLETDLKNAGAKWRDEEVVVDQGLVTSRSPDDLDAFNAKLVEEFAEGAHQNHTA